MCRALFNKIKKWLSKEDEEEHMPDQTKMMFVRPINCHDCGNGYYALAHARDYAETKGFTILDIEGTDANQGPVWDALDTEDPGSFYGFGHGNVDIYTGDSEQMIFDTTHCDKLAGRIVYLLSCLTANQLGPAIRDAGALGYAGFDISWTWMTENSSDGDPYEDGYANGFYRSANALWESICDGKTLTDAATDSVATYDYWIDYWLYTNNNDPYASEAIKWLVHDREGLIFYPTPDVNEIPTQHYCEVAGGYWYDNACYAGVDCLTLTNENDCINNGCYWWNESCHYEEEPPPGPNLLFILPILLVVGIAFIAYQK